MRTSTSSMPSSLAAGRAVFIMMASVNSVRSAVTTCCNVRCVTTLLMLSRMVSPKRPFATSSLPPVVS